MEIVLKYSGNTLEINRACLRKAGKLGEIHQNRISTYFTERSGVYFHRISTVFLFNYFTERSEVYFHCISTVFLPYFPFPQFSPFTIKGCSPLVMITLALGEVESLLNASIVLKRRSNGDNPSEMIF